MGRIRNALAHAWNAFLDNDRTTTQSYFDYGATYGVRPDRGRFTVSNERSIIASIYTRLSVDVSSLDIRHVRLDDNDRYIEEIPSGLNSCLELEANLDQTARSLIQDVVMMMCQRGVAAIVPVDVTINPNLTSGYDILTLRVGEVVSWMPKHVKVNLYNEATGRKEEITLEKRFVAIVENPFYSVMNEPNSTLQRLIRTLNNLDAIDQQSASGKLDMIIQLPYVIKSDTRRKQAEQRRKDLEFQLKGSQYGIAYTDGTEKVTQLNRPAENNLMKQVEFLVEMVYGELGLTVGVMNGTATEQEMLNYINRTVEPITTAIVAEMRRKFLTKTARTQKQSIWFFRDPFKLIPIANIAEIADKFTRNEVLSPNEVRGIIGMRPHDDKRADVLMNRNMPIDKLGLPSPPAPAPADDEATSGLFDEVNQVLDETFRSLGVDG